LSAAGNFNVVAGGCDDAAGYSKGSVPLLRFFDDTGRRVVGLYRINGSCGKQAKLYVQHSNDFFRAGANIALGQWNHAELRVTVSEPGASLVQVYLNGRKIYESTTANNGIRPLEHVNLHNEHPNQKGELLADDVRIATVPVAPPTNPCEISTGTPTLGATGTAIVADNFETFDFSRWSPGPSIGGDGVARVQAESAYSGNCAARLTVSSSTGSRANLQQSLSGADELWADGQFLVAAEGVSGSNVPFFRVLDALSVRTVDLYRQNGGGALYLRLSNGSGGFSYISMGRTLALDTWYRLTVHASTTGTIEVLLDDQSIYSSTTQLRSGAFATLMIGSEHFSQQMDLVVDDAVIMRVP
jgi:hypothetical protein